MRTAVIAAHGAIPIIGNAYATGGEAVPLAIADPSNNPWLDALPMARELITRTIGHYEAAGLDSWTERTSMLFWARRFSLHALHGSATTPARLPV